MYWDMVLCTSKRDGQGTMEENKECSLAIIVCYSSAWVSHVEERDELKASVLTDNVRRCINISITSAKIRSRAGYGLSTFLNQSLVRSIDEDMAVCEGIGVCLVVLVESLGVDDRFLNAVLADQFVIPLPLFHLSHFLTPIVIRCPTPETIQN